MSNPGTQNSKHIQLRMLLFMSLRDLWTKRFRSSLTLIGVMIGIGSIFFLLSFGLGLQALVQQQVIGNKAIDTIDISSPNSEVLPIGKDSLEKIEKLNNVTGVTGLYSYAGTVTVEEASADTVVYGVDDLYLNLGNLTLKAGGLLAQDKDDEVMINDSLLQSAGIDDAKSALGKKISLNVDLGGKPAQKSFTISGIIDSGAGSEVFITQKLFENGGINSFSQIKAQIADRSATADTRKAIESFGYETSSPVDTLEQINQVFKFFNFVLAGFGSIGLIIAVLGMVNTLTVSLLERTHEIALMITLGARRIDMRNLFIFQGVILSVTGGILGMVSSGIFGLIINGVLNSLAGGRGVEKSFSVFAAPPLLILGVIVFTLVVGYLVAFFPARRAASINTIEALRHE